MSGRITTPKPLPDTHWLRYLILGTLYDLEASYFLMFGLALTGHPFGFLAIFLTISGITCGISGAIVIGFHDFEIAKKREK